MTRTVTAAALRAMLSDGGELALLDVREELLYSENHLLHARSLPLSRLELRLEALVPRHGTRLVLCDGDEGLADRAAALIESFGYCDVAVLAGGTKAWAEAAYVLFSGMNVPSKAFGEFIEHKAGTPSIAAEELHGLIDQGAQIVVLDSRPFDEY
ncbi:MAG: rhodanese-like domain-containing protein, partial [Stellaceae bacterium]